MLLRLGLKNANGFPMDMADSVWTWIVWMHRQHFEHNHNVKIGWMDVNQQDRDVPGHYLHVVHIL